MITRQQAIDSSEFHRGECRLVIGERKATIDQRVYWKDAMPELEVEGFRLWLTQGQFTYVPVTDEDDWHCYEECPFTDID